MRALIGQSAMVYCASSLMEKSRVFFLKAMVYKHDKPTNSSRVLSTSRVVYQPINQRNMWSIA